MKTLIRILIIGAIVFLTFADVTTSALESPSHLQTDILPPLPIEFPTNALLSVQSIPNLAPAPVDPSLLFIIDFTDFMCPACLDSLLNLCRLLPRHIQQERVWGIVVFPHPHSTAILEKKVRGFQKANNIAFPILLDRDHIFRSLAAQGTTLFLFNPLHGSIIKLSFPISSADTERLLKLWLGE